jgi:hypothetical protein
LPWSAVDYNRDGAVDAADYALWRKLNNLSGTNLPADGNLNNQVNSADYSIWRANFGRSAFNAPGSGGGLPPSVPEPGTLVLVVLSLLFGAVSSRRFPRALFGHH